MKFGHTFTFLALAAIAVTTASNINASAASNFETPVTLQQTTASSVEVVSSGEFSGRSDHVTTGQVLLEKTSTGYQLRFAGNFKLDGAPDPVVAIGNGETFLATNKLGTLKKKKGAQVYELPAGFTPADFSEVYVWCEKFSVPLGVAVLIS